MIPPDSETPDSLTHVRTRDEDGNEDDHVEDGDKTRTSISHATEEYAAQGLSDDLGGDEPFEKRYVLSEILGEGGMGIVYNAADRRIGREVAVKNARGTAGDVRARFVREARVQGQLEHPAIVPVHDLALDSAQNPYFTMRRVRGVTLDHVFQKLRDDDKAFEAQYSRRKLLTAFGNICLAIHYGHTRGVFHRDIKPANIMFGDFGEVYVLDWGLAKVKTGAVTDAVEIPFDENAETFVGELMGTPGYMAPEQARGSTHLVDARSDVYSLGAILFEILTLIPLHPRRDAEEAIRSTLSGANARFETRVPDLALPPELEAICVRATESESRRRYDSARDLSDAVWRFLDGDRDLATRRSFAKTHVDAATEHAVAALLGGENALAARSLAMAEVSRALALEPENDDAVRIFAKLLTAPPKEMPQEVEAAWRSAIRQSERDSALAAMVVYGSWIGYLPLLTWMGIRDGIALGAATFLWASTVAATIWLYFAPERHTLLARYALVLASTAAIATTSTVFGPFVLLPAMASINASVLVFHTERSLRIVASVLSMAAAIVPVVFGLSGLVGDSYIVEQTGIRILPGMLSFTPTPTLILLTLSNVAIVATSLVLTAKVRDSLSEAQRQLHLQAWQLRKLLPTDVRRAAELAEQAHVDG